MIHRAPRPLRAASLALLAILLAAGCGGDENPASPHDTLIDFPGDAPSLRDAIAAASPGDTVRVGAGTHEIDSTLVFGLGHGGVLLLGRIEGSQDARPVLRIAGAQPRTAIVIAEEATGVTIRGLEFRGPLTAGIRVRTSGCRIADCAIFDAGSHGVSCEFSDSDPVIEASLIVRPGIFGVNCSAGSHPVVERNTIYHAGDCGIYADFARPECSRNIIAGSANFGIACVGITDLALSCNDVFGSGGANYGGCGEGAGDIQADPLFCDTTAFGLAEDSPCAAANAGACGGIGYAPASCPAAPPPPPPDHVIDFPAEAATLQGAIEAASPGDTIRVAPGSYELSSTLLFDESRAGVTLMGRGAGSSDARPSLRMAGPGRKTGIAIEVGASGIVVRGLELRGSLYDGIDVNGIGCQVTDCAIRRAYTDAIASSDGNADPIIDGNLITWPGVFGVHSSFGSKPVVTGNTILGAADCGVFSSLSTLRCERNIVAQSSNYGFYCVGGTVTLACNALFQNGLADYSGNCEPGAGDIHADPLFCDTTSFALSDSSPCAPANAGTCGGMGAAGVGCP